MPSLNKNSGLEISGVAWGLDVGLGDRTRISLCVHKFTFKHSILHHINTDLCIPSLINIITKHKQSFGKELKFLFSHPIHPPSWVTATHFIWYQSKVTCLKDPTISSVKTMADLGYKMFLKILIIPSHPY